MAGKLNTQKICKEHKIKKMIHIVITNVPSATDGKKWDPVQDLKCKDRGKTIDDRWWWAFQSKSDAHAAMKIIETRNANTKMKLYLSCRKQIPEEWK